MCIWMHCWIGVQVQFVHFEWHGIGMEWVCIVFVDLYFL
jgi:hypothetical protein